jgi:hypothetical protein
MKFAKLVFWIAGIWGVAVLAPAYFIFDRIGREDPPAITHPEFYFGFLGVALAWQFVFLVVATDPLRYRPIIALSVLEKVSYVFTLGLLFLLGHLAASASLIAVPDATLAVLFVVSFLKTRPAARLSRETPSSNVKRSINNCARTP